MSEARLLEELLRGEAPQHMLLQEGFTPQEIRDARKRVTISDSLERNSGPAADRDTMTLGSGDRGASVPTSATTLEPSSSSRVGGQDVGARRALEPAHSGITGGAASD